jgi:hypothetical protein
MLLCFALAGVGIWLLDGSMNRLLLTVLVMGVLAFGALGVAYAVTMVWSLFHVKNK